MPSRIHFSFQHFMKCKFHNSLVLILMQIGGGGRGYGATFLKNYFKSVRSPLKKQDLPRVGALFADLRELPPESSLDA